MDSRPGADRVSRTRCGESRARETHDRVVLLGPGAHRAQASAATVRPLASPGDRDRPHRGDRPPRRRPRADALDRMALALRALRRVRGVRRRAAGVRRAGRRPDRPARDLRRHPGLPHHRDARPGLARLVADDGRLAAVPGGAARLRLQPRLRLAVLRRAGPREDLPDHRRPQRARPAAARALPDRLRPVARAACSAWAARCRRPGCRSTFHPEHVDPADRRAASAWSTAATSW